MEVDVMPSRSLIGFAAAAAIGLSICSSAHALQPSPYAVSAPITHGNLSVYPIRGAGGGGPVPLTLDEALTSGAAKVKVSPNGDRFTIENFSDRSVFIQMGDLIRGGLQDQVMATGMLVPPGSGPITLAVFCVDEGRSVARGTEDPFTMSGTGTLVPSRIARLIMLSSRADSTPTMIDLRQAGIWLSASAVEHALWRPTGAPAASNGSKSLPVALALDGVAQALRPTQDALAAAAAGPDVIGAAFAIDGKLVGADIYGSHALFAKLWPKLLRAYATEAIVAEGSGSASPPTMESVAAFLAATEHREARLDGHATTGDSAIGTSAVTARDGDDLVHRAYVPRFDEADLPLTPEATALRLVDLGLADLGALGARPAAAPAPRALSQVEFVNAVHDARMNAPQGVPADVRVAAMEYFLRVTAERRATETFSSLSDPGWRASHYRFGPAFPFIATMLIPMLLAMASLRFALRALARGIAVLARALARNLARVPRAGLTTVSFVVALILVAVLALARVAHTGWRQARASLAMTRAASTPARLAAA
jgi:hypothetical protein